MLVRYMGLEYGVKTVESGLFKLLRPLDANDPYEMMGATVGRLSDVAQKELCDDMRYEWAKAPLVMGTRPVPPIEEVLERVANSMIIWIITHWRERVGFEGDIKYSMRIKGV